MRVRVDQAGQHRSIGKVDRLRSWRGFHILRANADDLVSLDDDCLVAENVPGLHVKEMAGANYHAARWGLCLPARAHRREKQYCKTDDRPTRAVISHVSPQTKSGQQE